MANAQHCLIERSKVPSRNQWQKAINDHGIDFKLDPDLKAFEAFGLMPCTLMGREAGVEICYDDSPETLAHFRNLAPGKDYCISFRWGGSMIEYASAMIASYALAKHFDAVVSYEGNEPYPSLDALLEETNSAIKKAMRET